MLELRPILIEKINKTQMKIFLLPQALSKLETKTPKSPMQQIKTIEIKSNEIQVRMTEVSSRKSHIDRWNLINNLKTVVQTSK